MHLSSLHFLEKDSDVTQHGSTRPNSRQAPVYHSPVEEKRLDDKAFQVFPDYSKYNSDRHNAQRSDTFHSASSPVRKKAAHAKSTSETREDLTALNSAYLISGIRSDVREIGKEISTEVQNETQQTLASMQTELQTVFDKVTDTSESTISVIMERITVDIHKILSAAGWPLKVDFSPIQDEFREGEYRRVQGYNEMMGDLEQRLAARLTPLVDELPITRKSHQQLQKDFWDAHNNLLEEMRAMKQTLIADVAEMLRQVRSTQQEHMKSNIDMEARLEAQAAMHAQQAATNAGVSDIMSKLEQCATREDIGKVIEELENTKAGMLAIPDLGTIAKRGGGSGSYVEVDVDSNWTQTDTVLMVPGFAQTDDKFWKAKAAKDRQTHHSSVQAKDTVGGGTVTVQKQANQFEQQGNKHGMLDAEDMKKKARQALIKHQYHVFDLYWDSGISQRIAKSPHFEHVTFFMVFLNALWISVDADYNDAVILIDANPVFQVAEHLFCLYFSCELLVRFFAFRRKLNCCKDAWFVFDLVLVAMMALETWVMSAVFLALGSAASVLSVDASILRVVRIVKILRLSRLARLMRAVPEITIFCKGIGAASRSVLSLFALWLIIIYVFAVFFVQTVGGDAKKGKFHNVPSGMNTLLLEGIFPDNSPLVEMLYESNPAFWPVIVGFVLLASITLSYMLIGVLVQIVQVIASTEKEKALIGIVVGYLRGRWKEKGHDMETILLKADFQLMLVDIHIAQFLNRIGVDVMVLVEMSDMIFEDAVGEQEGLSFESFIEIVLNARGANQVTVKDIKSQMRATKRMIKKMNDGLEKTLQKKFTKCMKEINGVRRAVLGEEEDSDEDSTFVGADTGISDSDDDVQRDGSAVSFATTPCSLKIK